MPRFGAMAMLVMAAQAVPLQAQVKADPTAPGHQQPTVLNAPNGTPMVNIQTPSAAGVSRNRYSQMDISGQGVILNNARTGAQTHLGGAVAGNPWLARGEARVILNEVGSQQPMRLNGFVEVAGRTADVIIASPSGLQIDGGGFLNADRVTLTTGTPRWGADGTVQGFDVRDGAVQVHGQGLDASRADYTAILARALTLNAGVWARALEVSMGTSASSTAPAPAPAPAHALDSTALGGLYAERITLVASEDGLGVRHHGRMMADTLRLDVHGQLHNAGSLQAMAATDEALVLHADEVRNDGWITSRGSATLQAGRLSGSEGSVTAAGWQPDGPSGVGLAAPGGHLHLRSSGEQRQAGQLLSSGALVVSGGQLDLGQAQAQAQRIQLDAGRINAQGAVLSASETLRAQAAEVLDSRRAHLSAQRLDLQAPRIDGSGAEWLHLGATPLTVVAADGLTLDGARIGSNATQMMLSAGRLQADGMRIDHHEGTQLTVVADQLSARGAQWRTEGRLVLEAAAADLSRGELSAGALRVQAGTLDLSGAVGVVRGDTALDIGDFLRTDTGALSSGGRLDVEAARWHHTGTVQGLADVHLRVGQLDHHGTMLARGDLDLHTEALRSTGTLAAGWQMPRDAASGASLHLTSTGTLTHSGLLMAQGDAQIQAPSLDLRGSQLSADTLRLMASQGDLLLDHARTSVDQDFLLTAVGLASLRGTHTQAGRVHWMADMLDHRGGSLLATGDASLRGQTLWNGDGGLVRTGGTTVLDVGQLDNTQGRILADGGLTVHARDTLLNQGGTLLAAGVVQLEAGRAVDNTRGEIAGQSVRVLVKDADGRAGTLNNQNGQLLADQTISVTAGTLDNTHGKVLSAGTLTLALDGDYIHHRGDQLAAAGAASLDTTGRFVNQGLLHGGASLTITARDIDLLSGSELSAGEVELSTPGTLSNRGVVDGDKVRVQAHELLNTGTGQLFGDHLSIRADAVLNGAETGKAAVIAAREVLNLDVAGDLVNRDGALILSDGSLTVAAGSLRNENAGIESTGDMRLDLRDRLDNLSLHEDTHGPAAAGEPPRVLESLATISAGGHLAIQAQTVVNSGATIDVRGDLDLQAASLHNLNPALQWTVTETSEREVRFELPDGKGSYRPEEIRVLGKIIESTEGWVSAWGSQAQDSLEPFVHAFTPGQSGWSQDTYHRQLLLPSDRYPNEVFGRYLGGDGGALGGGADRAFTWLRSADHVGSVCEEDCHAVVIPGQHYAHDDRIWTDFGVMPGDDEGLDRAMAVFYQDANRRLVGGFTFVDVTSTQQQAQVTQSGAGRIVVGGQLSIRGGELVNQMSQVVGRDGVDIQADHLRNEGVVVRLEDREQGDRYRTYNLGSGEPNTGIDHAVVHAVTPHSVSLVLPALTPAAGLRPALDGRPSMGVGEAAHGAQGSLDRLDQPWEGGGGPSGRPPVAVLPSLGGGGNGALQAVLPNLRLPANSLYAVKPEASATHLIATDTRFAGHRTQLSSDFLLKALSLGIEATQKRLGDGAYEQRLVREQLRHLTGSQFLPGQDSDEATYRALMTEGASFAALHQLQPGVALSAEQMAQLTSDLVWLVEQTVSLADGSQQRVLVPQVYLVPRAGDVSGEGALIAGERIQVALTGDVLNQGTLQAGDSLRVQAQSVLHSGSLRATSVALTTRDDLVVRGGSMAASGDLQLQAGRDLHLHSTLAQADTAQSHRAVLDRLASLEAGGTLVLGAGRDLSLAAAELRQTSSEGALTLQAGRDLTLDSLRASSRDRWTFNADNQQSRTSAADIGSALQAAGTLQASAGQDLTGRAAVVLGDGAVQLSAGRDVRLEAGQASVTADSQWKTTRRDTWSGTTERQQAASAQTWAQPSTVSGASTSIAAGRDLAVVASEVLADGALRLAAGRDVAITAAVDSDQRSEARSVSTSGLKGADGGLGFSIGKQSASAAESSDWRTVVGSTVGSVSGDVAIVAGGHYLQSGSSVAALRGDIDISAAKVDIESLAATSTQTRGQATRQSGVSVSLGSPVVDTVSGLVHSVSGVGHGRDLPSTLMGAANVANRLVQAPTALAAQLAQGGGVSVGVSIGGSHASSEFRSQADTVQASRVEAGGDVRIKAHGEGAGSSIRVQGSDITGGGRVSLAAEGAVDLASAQELSSSRSEHHSSGASVGMALGVGTGGVSAGWTAQASIAAGHSDSRDVTQRNTRVEGQTVDIRAGGDTTLRGAVVAGNAVSLEVGGQLLISSQQDSHRFNSQSYQASASVGGGKVSGSAGQSSAQGEQVAVREQSGVRAGDGGFQVSVAGLTTLQGGAITSTEAAVQSGLNSLRAEGGLALSDVQNHSSHKSHAASVAGGQSTPSPGGQQTTSGSAGVAGHSGGAGSLTQATISGLAGDADARTGDRMPDGFAALDMAAAQQQVSSQSQLLQEFGSMAAQVIGDYAASKMTQAQDLRAQAGKETDAARRDQLAQQASRLERDWGDEGHLRLVAHTAVGGLSGGVSGALSAAAGTWTAPRVDAWLAEAGVDPQLSNVLTALASSAVGAVAGGGAGASVAFNEVTGNYLTHKELLALRERLEACTTPDCRNEARTQATTLSQLRNQAVEDACLDGSAALCRTQLGKVQDHLGDLLAHPDGLGQRPFQPETANHIAQAEEKYRLGLQAMAHQAADSLGRPYVSPEELARLGWLTPQEAKDLQDFRAGMGVEVLGALSLGDGAGVRPNRPMAPGATAAEIEAQRKLINDQRVRNNADRDGGAEPHSSHPNTASTLALRDKIEIDQAGGTSNPHYSDKHGPYVSLAQQYERAMTGTNPQTGKKGAPVDASKFFNATDMEAAIREAEALYAANPAKYARQDLYIDFPRAVGEGYTGNTRANQANDVPVGEYRWTQRVVVRIDAKTGKAFTAFPDLKSGTAMPDPLKGGRDVH